MLKEYKNSLPDFFEKNGFKRNDFTISEIRDTLNIQYKESPMKFRIVQNQDNFHQFKFIKTLFNPKYTLRPFTKNYFSFIDIKDSFKIWIENELAAYIFESEGPDRLESWLNQYNKFVNIESINFNKNEPFKKSEIEALKTGLNEVKDLIIEQFNLAADQQKIVSERINYLIESSKRAKSKTDWKNILIATIFNLCVTLALDPEKAKQLWLLFDKVLNQIPLIGEFIKTVIP